MKKGLTPWIYRNKEITEINLSKHLSFVYELYYEKTNKLYIGYKATMHRKGDKMVESDWATYTGSNKSLNEDIKKYGAKYLRRKILRLCESRNHGKYFECKIQLERDVILNNSYYNRYISFKMNSIGLTDLCYDDNPRHSEETKKKISNTRKEKGQSDKQKEALKKVNERQKGKNHPMYGKKHSKETKEKWSKDRKGNKYCLGYKHTDESKEKMRLSQLGRKDSEETRKKKSISKIGNKNGLGHKRTDEHKKAISDANKGNKHLLGHKHSEETKEK